jgi:predicted secreted acid phosphatase
MKNDIYLQKMREGKHIIDNRNKDITNYVAIFDIDDTILNTQTNQLIHPIFSLYTHALQQHVYTVFITAREATPENMKQTVKQLQKLGIKGYDLLYFRPSHLKDVKEYKLFARKNVMECGYTPLFSVGDMEWDAGEYGGIPLYLCQ